MASAAPVIEVAGLVKQYRRAEAVSDVSFAVYPGEIFGLLGPDGAGKSTVIQVLAGVLLPTRGHAYVAGIDVVRDPERVKARIGYMPQGLGLNLYDDLSVEEHLRFFAELRGVPEVRFREHRATLLEVTRLAPAADRLARHLSGGMRQKLGLASALIHLPDVLLLDEPTTGVDPLSRRDFWQIITRLSREQGMTVLVSTPYLDEAERCTRVALMARGRLLATTHPEFASALLPGPVPQSEPTLEDVFVALMTGRQDAPPPEPGAEPAAPRSPMRGAALTARQPARPDGPAVRDGSPVIEVDGLTKRFGALAAVDGVTFAVRPGEIFGFLGPTGAGKTTTIKMLTGLLRPSGGRGLVAGYDVRSQPGEIKAAIGYMSQRFSLYPDLTVQENLGLYARIYGLSGRRQRERTEAVMALAGLEEYRRALARELPLGFRQRLALAGAILHEPRVLFLDEPTSGVDPLARRQFWDLIGGLARQGVTILVTTHYMKEAELCHRLALIHQGRLVALGEPETIRREAERRRGRVLEVVSPQFRESENLLGSLYPGLILWGRRIHVFSFDPQEDLQRIPAVLARAGIERVEVREVPMAMDEVFATLIETGVGGRAAA